MRLFKSQLQRDIDEYLQWKQDNVQACSTDRMYLAYFAKFSRAINAADVTYEEVLKFKDNLFQKGTHYTAMAAMKAVRCFLRYHRARKNYVVDERVFQIIG